jgi:hypothetical protein
VAQPASLPLRPQLQRIGAIMASRRAPADIMMRHMGSHASIKDNCPDLSAVGCAGRTVGFRLAYQARCCLAKAFSRKRLDLNDEIGCRS